jgi:hypothetical protein
VDPSALIFIALAVAWAAYLIPKALEQHEEGARTRSIDRFSHGLRVLARREPRGRKRTELVTSPEPLEPTAPAAPLAPEPATMLVPAVLTPAQRRARRRARALAARRRRRVLDLLVLANVVVAALALLGILAWHWQAVPAALVPVWLVVCRVSVRRARRPVMERRPVVLDPAETGEIPAVSVALAAGFSLHDVTDEISRILDEPDLTPAAPEPVVGGWDLQPVVVPTYVAKDRARRSVRTIDLDSTGVWSSGRNAADSALVRDAEAGAEATPDESDGSTSATA